MIKSRDCHFIFFFNIKKVLYRFYVNHENAVFLIYIFAFMTHGSNFKCFGNVSLV